MPSVSARRREGSKTGGGRKDVGQKTEAFRQSSAQPGTGGLGGVGRGMRPPAAPSVVPPLRRGRRRRHGPVVDPGPAGGPQGMKGGPLVGGRENGLPSHRAPAPMVGTVG